MSKAQLTAFMVKVDADAALKARVDAAGNVDAVLTSPPAVSWPSRPRF
ncbi:MAG: Nif11 family protein [Cyanobacteria bacterium M_DeepCast_100m_m1_067]|nr:Nif11 family protein [Cyanobacteria bacterium M_DeepCast_100m_m1_067]